MESTGADVNAVDDNGLSCLHYACKGLKLLTLKYLVDFCGAALDKRDNYGRLPSSLCVLAQNDNNICYVLEMLKIIKSGLRTPVENRSLVLLAPTM